MAVNEEAVDAVSLPATAGDAPEGPEDSDTDELPLKEDEMTRSARIDSALLQSTLDPWTLWSICGRILFRPMAFTLLWLLIPLGTTRHSANIFLFIFLFRWSYYVIAAYTGFIVLGLVTPTPRKAHRVGLAMLAGLAGCLVDLIVVFFSSASNLRFSVFGSVCVAACVFFGTTLAGVLSYDYPRLYVTLDDLQKYPRMARYIGGAGAGSDLKRSPSQARLSMDDCSRDALFNCKRFFVEQFTLVVCLIAIGLVAYAYCQLFTYFFSLSSDEVKIALAGLFRFTLKPFELLLGFVASKIDSNCIAREAVLVAHGLNPRDGLSAKTSTLARTLGLKSSPRLEPMIMWQITLFYYLFYRSLFTNVTTLSTFLFVQGQNLVLEIMMYPLRMTQVADRWRVKWQRLYKTPESIISLGEQRRMLATNYFFLTMGQRISVMSFAAYSALLHNYYNKNFFVASASDNDARFEQLMFFCLYMLLIEWTGSTTVWFVIKLAYNIDVVLLGSEVVIKACLVTPSILLATHVMQDVYVALFRFNFDDATF